MTAKYTKVSVSAQELAAHDPSLLPALQQAQEAGHEVHVVVDSSGNKFFLAIDDDGVPTKAVEVNRAK